MNLPRRRCPVRNIWQAKRGSPGSQTRENHETYDNATVEPTEAVACYQREPAPRGEGTAAPEV
jgi:hypothetical protein